MVDLANSIWRDFATAGIPATGANKPKKSKIREWGTYVESLTMAAGYGNTVWFATKALLTADLAHDAGTPAIVYADTTAANNGIYLKSGASGAGSWGQIITYLPGYQFVTATDAGDGTANAIVATSSPRVAYADGVQMIRLNIYETNTSSTVTVAFDGGVALAIKTSGGNNPAIGGLTAGMTVLGVVDQSATVFRLLSDQASAAIVSDAEAALDAIRDLYLGAFANDTLATAAAGGSPTTGATYWNTSDAKLRVWTGSAWADTSATNNFTVDTFTGDGTTDPLTLTGEPGSINNVTVIIEGYGPQPKAAFTLAGDQITPTEAWPSGAGIEINYGSSVEVGTPADGTVSRIKMANDAIGADQIDAAEAAAIKTKLGIAAASSLLPGFFTGFKLANSGSHGIVFNPGAAWSDDGDPILIVLDTATTKLINATFVAGTGNGGLDTGTVAAGTYHAWVVSNDDGSTVDVIFSLSTSAPTMPSGYTKKAYLWPVVRGASANWNFIHHGDHFTIADPTSSTDTALSTTAVLKAMPGVPTGVAVLADFVGAVFDSSTNITAFFTSPSGTDVTATSGARSSLTTAGSSRWVSGGFTLLTNTSAQIRAKGAAAISNCSVTATGWRYAR